MGKKKGKKIAYIEGIYSSSNRGGFVDVDENYSVFIPPSDRKGAFEKDKVKVEITLRRAGKKDEGKVVEIVERGITKVVGVLDKSKEFGFVIPDGKDLKEDIFIPKKELNGAKDGQMVICKITEYPKSRNNHAEGEIIEIIGYKDEPGVDIRAIVESMNIPDAFPEEVLAEADKIPDTVSPEASKGRLDLRDKITVTIDSESAKDLDDAISIEKDGDIYRLYVSIADVSNYVTLGSKLNEEAIKRGTSAYLCNRVIPMLPKKLSNGICSLNEKVDRLTLSCIMDIDKKGNVVSHQIAETVINVNHRMSYVSVQKILDGDEEEIETYKDIAEIFPVMYELSKIIRAKRHDRGGSAVPDA